MNKVILLGRLTKEPEIRYSQINNSKVANFTLAVNRKYAKQGEENQTDFISIVAFSKLAEFIEKYLVKGFQICVRGRIQTRNWEDKCGQKHYVTEVVAEEIDFADSQRNVDNNSNTSNDTENPKATETIADTSNEVDVFTDGEDLPF